MVSEDGVIGESMKLFPKSRQSFIRSFVAAFRGLRYALEGRNFVVTLVIGIVVLILSYFVGLNTEARIVIVLADGMVLAAEIFNTAVEEILDVVVPHYDPRVGRIKDLVAGGVLIFSGMAVVITVRLFLGAIFGGV